jgi:hypothetical protein
VGCASPFRQTSSPMCPELIEGELLRTHIFFRHQFFKAVCFEHELVFSELQCTMSQMEARENKVKGKIIQVDPISKRNTQETRKSLRMHRQKVEGNPVGSLKRHFQAWVDLGCSPIALEWISQGVLQNFSDKKKIFFEGFFSGWRLQARSLRPRALPKWSKSTEPSLPVR